MKILCPNCKIRVEVPSIKETFMKELSIEDIFMFSCGQGLHTHCLKCRHFFKPQDFKGIEGYVPFSILEAFELQSIYKSGKNLG